MKKIMPILVCLAIFVVVTSLASCKSKKSSDVDNNTSSKSDESYIDPEDQGWTGDYPLNDTTSKVQSTASSDTTVSDGTGSKVVASTNVVSKENSAISGSTSSKTSSGNSSEVSSTISSKPTSSVSTSSKESGFGGQDVELDMSE